MFTEKLTNQINWVFRGALSLRCLHLMRWCFLSSSLSSTLTICSRCWVTSWRRFSSRTLLCCSLNVRSWHQYIL